MEDIRHIKIGDTVLFGTHAKTGKPEEWIVLMKNSQEKTSLIASTESVARIPYYNPHEGETDEPVTWKNSYLRKWLNCRYCDHFSWQEEEAIHYMKKCFLLSWVLLILFSIGGAYSEAKPDRVSVVDSFPQEILDHMESDPCKPDELSEASKAIIDADERITISNPAEYPFSAIAYLEVKYSCEHEAAGTGFMIGNNLLVTAGHCFYCPLCHELATEFTLYYGYLGKRNYFLRLTDSDWSAWIISGPVTEGKKYHEYDYGILRLSENIGEKTGYFIPRFNVPDQELSANNYHVAGYSGGILRQDTDRIVPVNEYFLKHYADMTSGDSGGPVFDDAFYAVAINTAERRDGTENYAVRFSSQIQDAFQDALD